MKIQVSIYLSCFLFGCNNNKTDKCFHFDDSKGSSNKHESSISSLDIKRGFKNLKLGDDFRRFKLCDEWGFNSITDSMNVYYSTQDNSSIGGNIINNYTVYTNNGNVIRIEAVINSQTNILDILTAAYGKPNHPYIESEIDTEYHDTPDSHPTNPDKRPDYSLANKILASNPEFQASLIKENKYCWKSQNIILSLVINNGSEKYPTSKADISIGYKNAARIIQTNNRRNSIDADNINRKLELEGL